MDTEKKISSIATCYLPPLEHHLQSPIYTKPSAISSLNRVGITQNPKLVAAKSPPSYAHAIQTADTLPALDDTGVLLVGPSENLKFQS